MKRKLISVIAVSVLMSACSAVVVPKSRPHFIKLMKEGVGDGMFKSTTYSKTILQSFETAFANIDDKLKGCVPGGYQTMTMRGSQITSSLSVVNRERIEKVSPTKAEITIQQKHSSTILQSKGGFYLLAADLHKIDERSIKIDFYTANHYKKIADAIEQWSKGSQKCHGIGGNP